MRSARRPLGPCAVRSMIELGGLAGPLVNPGIRAGNPMISPITVEVSRPLLERFKREAKTAFPRETFAYLLGQDAGDQVHIEDLWFPEDVHVHSSEDMVDVQPHWEFEAGAHAREEGLEVVGDIHSHPFRRRETQGTVPGREPSEGDLERGVRRLTGICTVVESKRGLRASIRFWWVPTRVRLRVTNGGRGEVAGS